MTNQTDESALDALLRPYNQHRRPQKELGPAYFTDQYEGTGIVLYRHEVKAAMARADVIVTEEEVDQAIKAKRYQRFLPLHVNYNHIEVMEDLFGKPTQHQTYYRWRLRLSWWPLYQEEITKIWSRFEWLTDIERMTAANDKIQENEREATRLLIAAERHGNKLIEAELDRQEKERIREDGRLAGISEANKGFAFVLQQLALMRNLDYQQMLADARQLLSKYALRADTIISRSEQTLLEGMALLLAQYVVNIAQADKDLSKASDQKQAVDTITKILELTEGIPPTTPAEETAERSSVAESIAKILAQAGIELPENVSPSINGKALANRAVTAANKAAREAEAAAAKAAAQDEQNDNSGLAGRNLSDI